MATLVKHKARLKHHKGLHNQLEDCRFFVRVSQEDFEEFVRSTNNDMEPPGIGEPFVLQHGDCNPTNFLVTTSNANQMPEVTRNIDWEYIRYLPKWSVATDPRSIVSYRVQTTPAGWEGHNWQWMLSNACIRLGFPLELEYTKLRIRELVVTRRHVPEDFIICFNLPIEGVAI